MNSRHKFDGLLGIDFLGIIPCFTSLRSQWLRQVHPNPTGPEMQMTSELCGEHIFLQSQRLCVDYRKPNVMACSDPFPMLRVDDLLDCLTGMPGISQPWTQSVIIRWCDIELVPPKHQNKFC